MNLAKLTIVALITILSGCAAEAVDHEETAHAELRGGGGGGGGGGAVLPPSTYPASVATYASDAAAPGSVSFHWQLPVGWQDSFPGSVYDQGTSVGIRIHQADGGEGTHPARPQRIVVTAIDGPMGALRPAFAHEVRMGNRVLTVEPDPNEWTTNALIISWTEAGRSISFWSEKISELEALQFLSTMSVFAP